MLPGQPGVENRPLPGPFSSFDPRSQPRGAGRPATAHGLQFPHLPPNVPYTAHSLLAYNEGRGCPSVASIHTRLEVLLLTSERPEGGSLPADEPQSMAALLEEEAAIPHTQLRRGDIIEGVVVGTDRDGILVDIGAKSEGVIPSNEMRCLKPAAASALPAGEKAVSCF